jgi:hypothetical protein
MIKIITIGLIPKNCDYKTIYCGDSESSGTVELNFKIENQQIIGLDNNLHLPFDGEVFTPNSKHLKELSKFILNFGLKLSSNSIYNGFSLLLNKQDSFYQKFKIIESIGGTFNNNDFIYNGKIYLRMYFDNNGEISDEDVCLKLL